MVNQVIDWPDELFRLTSFSFFPKSNSISPGVDLSGRTQIVGTGDQVWQFKMNFALDFKRISVLAFDAKIAEMQGRANIAIFDLCVPYRYDSVFSPAQEPFSDGTFFTDGTGFSMDGTAPILTTAAADIGATSIAVDLNSPVIPAPLPGQYFTHDNFFYIITGTVGDVVSFRPSLRTAFVIGDALITDKPRVMVRLASDNQGRTTRQWGRWRNQLSIDFVEAFDR